MEYTPSDSLCNGDWHSIVVSKNGITGTLIVDGQPPVTTTISNTGFVAVNTNAPLYAGGVPGSNLKSQLHKCDWLWVALTPTV